MNLTINGAALLISLMSAGAGSPAFADEVQQDPFSNPRMAVGDAELGAVRGGFSTGGLTISFGIEQAVFVNGALVATTTLKAADVGRASAGNGLLDAKTIALVQSGAGNSASVGAFAATALGSFVQNTLDGRKIEAVTVINASVNSLGLMRGFNLQSSLRGAVIDSLRR